MPEFSLPALYEVPADGNLTDLVSRNAARHPRTPVIARKRADRWEDVTAEDFLTEVRETAKGLLAAGVGPGDRVGLMSRSRYEWTLFDFAVWAAGGVTVPVFETSSPEEIAWVLGDSGAVGCVVETAEHEAAVEAVRDRLPLLDGVWRIEQDAVWRLRQEGTRVSDAELDQRSAVATADSPASIVYTSGTTGRPKGCVLTHRNFLAECGNAVERLQPLFRTGEGSVLLSLPPAHVFGRLFAVASVLAPIKLGHVGTPEELPAELPAFRPTVLLGVPQVFERLYNTARANARAAGRGRLFDRAAEAAIAYSRALDTSDGPSRGLRLRHRLYDRLVFRELRRGLGGRARHAVCGGSALGERLGHFFRGVGCPVLEGYGLTESCAATAFNPYDRQKIGTAGQPLPGSVLRIADDGEVLLHGEHLFAGYWKDDAATAVALSDGWFHTGDLGALDEAGYLTISGRKSEVITTADGMRTVPSALEGRIRAHELVGECVVVGEGRPFLGALITLDEEFVSRWTTGRRGSARPPAGDPRNDPELLAAVQQAVDEGNAAVGAAAGVRRFRVLASRLSQEAGHLTPTLVVKRAAVMKDFAHEIEALYR
ncbi:AMP-dependent synthetase/ligase [Streptomyces sp. TP-A0874]|uniref:AMP-dependent synthetase/ligase n=1 Tax=Streptomyces sp. TP-A0874 TaxID=549819 RepID=UPI000853B47B|nr:AMP-dependent synthetase/ligase [Streptomyces sp. TP-A0874]